MRIYLKSSATVTTEMMNAVLFSLTGSHRSISKTTNKKVLVFEAKDKKQNRVGKMA